MVGNNFLVAGNDFCMVICNFRTVGSHFSIVQNDFIVGMKHFITTIIGNVSGIDKSDGMRILEIDFV